MPGVILLKYFFVALLKYSAMKKIFLPVLIAFSFCVSAQTTKNLSKILELKIAGEGGANGGCVVYHPVQKKYYAALAGNQDFPMGVYDVKGKQLSPDDQKTMFDLRGLWYNPKTKKIQANGFKENGWAEYTLDTKGIPVSVKILQAGMNQPDSQNIAAFDPVANAVYFLNYGNVDKYDYADGKFIETITLYPGKTKDDDDDLEGEFQEMYNVTTVIFTGTSGSELGLLNDVLKQVELYSAKTGYLTRVLKLPDNAPTNYWMNFAYSNGIYWLFDKTARIWIGYK